MRRGNEPVGKADSDEESSDLSECEITPPPVSSTSVSGKKIKHPRFGVKCPPKQQGASNFSRCLNVRCREEKDKIIEDLRSQVQDLKEETSEFISICRLWFSSSGRHSKFFKIFEDLPAWVYPPPHTQQNPGLGVGCVCGIVITIEIFQGYIDIYM